MKRYCIKEDYAFRTERVEFDDTHNTDNYQDKVYARIQEFFLTNHLKSILDIGCGSGYKLMKYFHEYDTVGLEIGKTLDFLKNKYAERVWGKSDFLTTRKSDIAIAIDVIEHLPDPDDLLIYLKDRVHCKYIALSTPERDKLPSPWSVKGPPRNVCHLREWNFSEFRSYISKFFDIIEHGVMSHHDQYIIARKV